MPKPAMSKPAAKAPAFLDAARAFYGEAFEHHTKRDLARSMKDWDELEESEQSFAVAHLLYLNLQAQAAGQKLLTQVRDLLDEVAEGLTTAIEASLAEPEVEREEVGEEEEVEGAEEAPVEAEAAVEATDAAEEVA